MKQSLLSLLLLTFLSTSFADAVAPATTELTEFKNETKVLVFNVQKTENSGWKDEVFKDLVQSSDLVLIQESVDMFPLFNAGRAPYLDHFYKSWGNVEYNTGLTTFTKAPFVRALRLVSPDREPIASTPKVSSVEEYLVENSEDSFLVVNTHAINFTGLRAFKRQIAAVAKEVAGHKGPVLWAGDFNTWSAGRKRHLDSVMKSMNLKEVAFKNRSEVFLELDHVYTRGLKILSAEQLQLGISDHEPLRLSIEFLSSREQD